MIDVEKFKAFLVIACIVFLLSIAGGMFRPLSNPVFDANGMVALPRQIER